METLKKIYSEALLDKTGAKEGDTEKNFGLLIMLQVKWNNTYIQSLKLENLHLNSWKISEKNRIIQNFNHNG